MGPLRHPTVRRRLHCRRPSLFLGEGSSGPPDSGGPSPSVAGVDGSAVCGRGRIVGTRIRLRTPRLELVPGIHDVGGCWRTPAPLLIRRRRLRGLGRKRLGRKRLGRKRLAHHRRGRKRLGRKRLRRAQTSRAQTSRAQTFRAQTSPSSARASRAQTSRAQPSPSSARAPSGANVSGGGAAARRTLGVTALAMTDTPASTVTNPAAAAAGAPAGADAAAATESFCA